METDYSFAPLSIDDARARLEVLAVYLANRHGIKVTWLDPMRAKFTGKYLVVKIDGEITLTNGRAMFKGEDPGFLWRSRAREYIHGKLATYLDPKTDVKALPTS